MMTEWRGMKVTPGKELTLNGFQILGGKASSIHNPPSTSSPSSSQGQRQLPSCSWSGDDNSIDSQAPITRNRFFFSKDTAVVLTRLQPDTIDLHVSKYELNSDGARDSRRNSESFGYRLIRNNTTAPAVTCRQPRKTFQPGKRLPATPRPAVSTAIDPSVKPSAKVAGALICTKCTVSNPSTRPPLTFRKRTDPSPGSAAGKEEEEPDQNLTDQPRRSCRRSSISVAGPPSLTCLDFRDRGRPPPTEPCPYSDPFSGSSIAFQKRIADLSSLVWQTVNWEKRKHSKTSKLQTKSG